jgi:hypothetical protein
MLVGGAVGARLGGAVSLAVTRGPLIALNARPGAHLVYSYTRS